MILMARLKLYTKAVKLAFSFWRNATFCGFRLYTDTPGARSTLHELRYFGEKNRTCPDISRRCVEKKNYNDKTCLLIVLRLYIVQLSAVLGLI